MFPNEPWKAISEIYEEIAEGVLGTKKAKQKPLTSKYVQELSTKKEAQGWSRIQSKQTAKATT